MEFPPFFPPSFFVPFSAPPSPDPWDSHFTKRRPFAPLPLSFFLFLCEDDDFFPPGNVDTRAQLFSLAASADQIIFFFPTRSPFLAHPPPKPLSPQSKGPLRRWIFWCPHFPLPSLRGPSTLCGPARFMTPHKTFPSTSGPTVSAPLRLSGLCHCPSVGSCFFWFLKLTLSKEILFSEGFSGSLFFVALLIRPTSISLQCPPFD